MRGAVGGMEISFGEPVAFSQRVTIRQAALLISGELQLPMHLQAKERSINYVAPNFRLVNRLLTFIPCWATQHCYTNRRKRERKHKLVTCEHIQWSLVKKCEGGKKLNPTGDPRGSYRVQSHIRGGQEVRLNQLSGLESSGLQMAQLLDEWIRQPCYYKATTRKVMLQT